MTIGHPSPFAIWDANFDPEGGSCGGTVPEPEPKDEAWGYTLVIFADILELTSPLQRLKSNWATQYEQRITLTITNPYIAKLGLFVYMVALIEVSKIADVYDFLVWYVFN